MYLLGYDIGTSSIKASLLDVDNNSIIGTISYPDREMDIISKQPGWAEQQPEVWWSHLCIATKKLLSQTLVDPKDIKGIGISYQMHGLVLIDKDHQVLRPSIIWCDSRAVDIGDQAFHHMGESFCLRNYLNSPGNFTASKLKWVKENEPYIYRKIYKILLPGDYINMKLSGSINTTISGLSEGILWNFKEKEKANKLLEHYGIDKRLLPGITPTFSEMGRLNKSAAIQTGLQEGTPITYRAGDQPNNAMSLNVLRKGEVAATCGTSGVVYGIIDRPIYDIGSRVNAFAHVNYEKNYDKIGILLCINGAGITYNWMQKQIAHLGMSYDEMEELASSIPIGSDGLKILPFGNGAERMLSNKNMGAQIHNLDFNRHTKAHLFRAALESIAFSFIYGINIMKDLGLDMNVIKVGNDNMFKSSIFSSTIASLLGNRIEVIDTTGSSGAARAAGVHSGIFDSVEDAFDKEEPIKIYNPKNSRGEYQEAYNQWLSLLKNNLENSNTNGFFTTTKNFEDFELHRSLITKSKTIASNSLKLEGLIKLIQDVRKDIKSVHQETKNPKLKDILSQIGNIELKTQNKDVFEEHFDILNDGFIQTLKKKHPSLKFDELKVCAMLKLNLSSKEIAQNLNLSIRGIETKRYRIRKKLGIKRGISLIKHFAYISH
ncbi:MAG: FGGY family carbohydrate kinase [Saprospiraceae bacterium]|nr:FGGY family carbohydrate kinase [Saprospiraceae bacterium]